MVISIIAAMDNNNLIGIDNEIPWKISTDLNFFKNTTMGYPLIMGRKTFESIGEKPLKGREHIIVSRNPELQYAYENVHTVTTIDDAIGLAQTINNKECFICGGGEIYEYVIKNDLVDKLYATKVETKIKYDWFNNPKVTFFPKIDSDVWNLIDIDTPPKAENDDYKIIFLTFKRK